MSIYLEQKAEMIKKEAEELQIPDDSVTKPVSDAAIQMAYHKTVIAGQAESIKDVLNKTKKAGEAAEEARTKIADVLAKLQALLKEIDGVGTVNMSRLNNIEEQLENETDTVRQLDREVLAVEQQSEIIKESIKKYTIDLDLYRAEKKLLQEMYEKLPKICPRLTPPPET